MQKVKRYAIITGIVVLVLFIVGIALAVIFDALLGVVYVTLIVLAAVTLIVLALQVYGVFAIIRTVKAVRVELQPLLLSAQETAGLAKETMGMVKETAGSVKETAKVAGQTVATIGTTARFTSEVALNPSLRAASLLVGTQQLLRALLGRGLTGKRADQRRREQMTAAIEGEE